MNLFSRRRAPPGSPPGSLVINEKAPPPQIRVMCYDADAFEERTMTLPRDVIPYVDSYARNMTWVDVHGLGDENAVRELGATFRIHPLALEDLVHVGQRPKCEEYERHFFIIMRHVELVSRRELRNTQIGLIMGPRHVITFQEFPGDPFDPVRERLRKSKGNLRKHGADGLTYALLDAVVDHFFPVVEGLGEELEALEDLVEANPRLQLLKRLHSVKSGLRCLRRVVWPTRDVLGALVRDGSDLVSAEARIHLRDTLDHATQVMDIVENCRELSAELTEIQLTSIANKTNEVMKVLTIVSTVFIPLSFIASIYNMSFDPAARPPALPDTPFRCGYPGVMLMMLAIVLMMLVVFYRVGWIAWSRANPSEDQE